MPPSVTHPGAAAQLHRLRLAQELQLDALRLAFTASALDSDRPWRSWMAADLDRALGLASALTALTADLVPGGPVPAGAPARTAAEDATADLLISYRTIGTLLGELLDGNRPLGTGHARQVVEAALDDVGRRVAELERDCCAGAGEPVQAGRASGAGASGDR